MRTAARVLARLRVVDAGATIDERDEGVRMSKNIFVLGLDEVNYATLQELPHNEDYDFHQLLTVEQLQEGTVSITELLDEAKRELDRFEGSIDAIVGYWDFPVTMMVPILCARYRLRSADLKAVVKCEHKYWSRLEQQKVIDEHPAFGLLDLHDDDPQIPDGLTYPVWIKPVKSASSEGAYYVEDDAQLQRAAVREREDVGRIGEPFGDILDMLDLPAEIAEVGGTACIVEEAATGAQVTVEGYSTGERIEVYGVVDSLTYPDSPSFLRYQYPSRLSPELQDRMADVSRRVIDAVGLRNSTFNIEYFWDADSQELSLLEVNARHSQSHARLFELVDGVSNHAIMLDLSLGREPRMPEERGPFPIAAKWFLRRFKDGIVRRVPSAEEIVAVEERIPGTVVHVTVAEGDRLSDGYGEDSYSYVLAEIFAGAQDEDTLERDYEQCLEGLTFEIDEVGGD